MRGRGVASLAVLFLLLAVTLGATTPSALAQDGGGDVPTQDIIPRPDSGEAPEEAGDRGGSLQLLIFGLVVAAIVGGATYVAIQSKRARAYPSASSASQADTPSMKPER